MASGYEMRVGDAEREATAAELREHYASGRLTLDELNERIDKAFAAKTRGDLDALMRDLPSARPGTAGLGGQRPGGPGWTGPGSGWAGPGSGWAGPGSGWTGQGAGPGTGWTGSGGPGAGWRPRAGHMVGQIVAMCVLIGALVLVGTLAVFGIGAGRPIGIVLLLAALSLLRRLVFGGRFGARGPRRRRCR